MTFSSGNEARSGARATRLILPVLMVAGMVSAATVQANNAFATAAGSARPSAPFYSAADRDKVIPGSYIVVLNESMARAGQDSHAFVQDVSRQLASQVGGSVSHRYTSGFTGFALYMDPSQLDVLLKDKAVSYVEEDTVFHLVDIQPNPTWGLDRIDERNLPLDNQYDSDLDGTGVNAYIIDTGLDLDHPNYGARANFGFDAINDGRNGEDCNGHGTHVGGTVGSITYGVAKNTEIWAVRVFGCGSTTSLANILAGMDWVNQNAVLPAVANMSLGGSASTTQDNLVQSMVDNGIVVVVAAGNENQNACNVSPARAPAAITVASSTSSDSRSSFSNWGSCVDLFAPGSSITSTWLSGGTNTISGTSMASPHVAGVAALVLDDTPSASVSTVTGSIIDNATTGVISGTNGSPNLLLYMAHLNGGTPPPPPPPTCQNELYFGDFESGGSDGWTTGNNSCSTGAFVVGNPDGVNNGGVQTQVSGSASGSGSLFTQPNTGGAGTDDVDGGTCEAFSPVISASGDVTISLDYFHGQRDAGDDASDGFVIDILNNGSVVGSMVSIGDVTTQAAWTADTATISNAGDVQLRIRATDGASAGDLVEAGIDNVQICGDEGTPPPPPPPPPTCTVDDDFEAGAAGWSNSATSTCTTGTYVLGNPTQQSNGGVITQVGGSNSGVNSIFTATNTSAGNADVDGGNCVLNSPTWSVADASTLSVAYFHGQRDAGDDPSGDFFRLEYSTNGGSSWNTLASNGDATSNAAWATATASIPAGTNVELRVQCSDGSGPGDLVECGIDDVAICTD